MAWPKKKKPSVAEVIRGGYQPEERAGAAHKDYLRTQSEEEAELGLS